jgi:hypothetical protein
MSALLEYRPARQETHQAARSPRRAPRAPRKKGLTVSTVQNVPPPLAASGKVPPMVLKTPGKVPPIVLTPIPVRVPAPTAMMPPDEQTAEILAAMTLAAEVYTAGTEFEEEVDEIRRATSIVDAEEILCAATQQGDLDLIHFSVSEMGACGLREAARQAANYNQLKALDCIIALSEGAENPVQRIDGGVLNELLQAAAESDAVGTAESILRRAFHCGAPLDIYGAMHVAASRGCFDVVAMCVAHGAGDLSLAAELAWDNNHEDLGVWCDDMCASSPYSGFLASPRGSPTAVSP